MKTEDKLRKTSHISKHICQKKNLLIGFSITIVILTIAGIYFFLGMNAFDMKQSKKLIEQREFVKKAKIGIITDWEDFGVINEISCQKLILKENTFLFLPKQFTAQNVFYFNNKIEILDENMPILCRGACIAYELDTKTNLISRMSIIPLEWGVTKDTAKVWRIEDGGMINNQKCRIIITSEYRQLLCPESFLRNQPLERNTLFYFETIPETNQVKLIKPVLRK